MTKKQLAVLTNKKAQTSSVKVSCGRGPETRIVTELCLSIGQQRALWNALSQYSEISPVGADVFEYLKNAMAEANIAVS